MRIALIVNPNSGRKNGGKKLPGIRRDLAAHSIIACDVFILQYNGHIQKIVPELNIENYDAIISMGGDGTNFHVLNSLLSSFDTKKIPPLGIIPVGAGNSFAKDLSINSIEDAIKAIVQFKPRPVDVCSFTENNGHKTYFVNLTGLGFVTDVAQTAEKFKFLKDFSYIVGVFHRTIHLAFHYMELEIDGVKIEGENCFVEFCNSRFTGGNMLMAPDAKIDDGYFDIIIADRLSRFSLLCTLPKIFSGRHIENPAVRHFKAKKACIKTVPDKILLPDGEILGQTPVTINIHPGLVRYL